MSVKITMNGRAFNSKDFAEQLKKDVLEKASARVRQQIEARLRGIHCPDHPVTGTVRVEMTDFEGGRISVVPCCEKVADQVRAVLPPSEG